jgi:hypothetical protein
MKEENNIKEIIMKEEQMTCHPPTHVKPMMTLLAIPNNTLETNLPIYKLLAFNFGGLQESFDQLDLTTCLIRKKQLKMSAPEI